MTFRLPSLALYEAIHAQDVHSATVRRHGFCRLLWRSEDMSCKVSLDVQLA